MPVQIDEITAEVVPAADASAPAPASPENSPSPEAELRRQRDLLGRLEARALRVCAD